MFFPLQRAAERIAHLLARLGRRAFRPRPAPADRAAPAANGASGLIRLTIHRRHIPILALLLLANIALIVAATLYVAGLGVSAPPAIPTPQVVILSPTPLPPQPASTEAVNSSLPALNIVISPVAAGPTPTAPPNPLSLGGTVFYAYRGLGRTNLWALTLGRPEPVRLTAGPWDDRDPVVSPDGTRLAFASRRDGSWNLYLLDLTTGLVKRLTRGLDFKGHPAWSPDSRWLVFEWYHDNNFDIAIVSAEGGNPIQLTTDLAADYEPVWSPNGREIVWVSMRNGNPDLWWLSLDHVDEAAYVALTRTPDIQEAWPAYSPNGQVVAYTDAASPLGLVYARPAADPDAPAMEAGQGSHPAWSPEGSSLMTVGHQNGQDYLLAAPYAQPGLSSIAYRAEYGRIGSISWSPVVLPETLPGSMAQASQVVDAPLWAETISQPRAGDPPYSLIPLAGVVAPDARLSDRVDEAFQGLRRAASLAGGWDFLATLDNALVRINAPLPPSADYTSWLKTGRAFDFAQASEQAGWVEVTREDLGFRTFWRVWVRTTLQDGSLGEPLRRPPWNFDARYSGRPRPYDAGGEYYAIMPPGYFVDFTTLAEDYGWSRAPAEANWISFFPGIQFWRFEHRGGLDWLSAIREVYTAQEAATQTPVPSPTQTPTITQTPTETGTPTETATSTPRPTRTPTQTFTPRPTRTPIPTNTRWPTRTPIPSNTPWPSRTPFPSRTPTLTPTPTGTWYTATPTPSVTPTATEHLAP